MAETLQTWINQDDCTSCGLCPDIAPAVFHMAKDGLAYTNVCDDDQIGSFDGLMDVPAGIEADVVEAAVECPGECIMIEVAGTLAVENA